MTGGHLAKTRVLKTKLQALLSDEEQQRVKFTAESIGIAENTLRALLRDDWDQLSRDAMERVCDRFECGIGDLFELIPDNFWAPFEREGRCTIFRGSVKQWVWDDIAAARVARFLDAHLPSVRVNTSMVPEDPSELVEYVQSHNCVVVGSPRSNPGTAVLFSRHFDAEPFVPSPENRAKIPVRFVFQKDDEALKKYAVVEPWSGRRGKKSGCGICDKKGTKLIVEADWLPKAEYYSRTVHRGRDCGVVLAIKKPFGTTRDVKTIVLGGFSGAGTEGAAKALVRDFRHLEPVGESRHVLGVVEAIYNKTIPNEDNRVLVGVRWKLLSGGRKKIDPS